MRGGEAQQGQGEEMNLRIVDQTERSSKAGIEAVFTHHWTAAPILGTCFLNDEQSPVLLHYK